MNTVGAPSQPRPMPDTAVFSKSYRSMREYQNDEVYLLGHGWQVASVIQRGGRVVATYTKPEAAFRPGDWHP